MDSKFCFVIFLIIVLMITVYVKKPKVFGQTPKGEDAPPTQNVPELPIKTTPKVKPKSVEPTEDIQTPKRSKQAKDFDEALAAAKEYNQNIFIYFGASWCPGCVKMKTQTLPEKDVKERLEKDFVQLIIDTDQDKTLARKFGIRGIPAYMILDKDGNILKKTSGFKSKTEFLAWLNLEWAKK